MLAYFDTSALMKKYLLEDGSEAVCSLFDQSEIAVFTSTITQIEGFHVLSRKQTETGKKIDYQKAFKAFLADMCAFELVPVEDSVIKQAQKIVARHEMKTLDSIHIASALTVQARTSETFYFISADDQQNKVAGVYGLKVINPFSEQ